MVENHVTKESTIDSDDSTSYVKLKDIVEEHLPQVILKQEIGKALPWVHIAISNAKRMLLDIYHEQLDPLGWGFSDKYIFITPTHPIIAAISGLK
ncbi:MAG: IS1595-like element ISCrsp1 family transposase [Bacteroidetes bacterium]|nr:IS1595-like element ISCrsp1 family transposase [Bacteroidota bacterium]